MRHSWVAATVAAGGLLVAGAGIGVAEGGTIAAHQATGKVAAPQGAAKVAAPQATAKVAAQRGPAKVALRIGVSAPQYDSPGGTVPTIVTVYAVPKSSKVSISATGAGGSTVTCTGSVWQNPVRHTASRTCYLQLPNAKGGYAVRGKAVVTTGSVVRTASGKGTRPVVADGVAAPKPMTMAGIQQIERCGNTTGDVWLTFDDGGSKAQVTSILATLKRNNVKGHFFFRGDWARKNPALFKTIKAAGHVIGNHTSSHPALSRMGKTNVVKQITAGTAATGTPKLLRPPFGAGAFTTRLQSHAKGQGYQLCRWTTDTYDWDGPSTALMTERIRYGDHRSAPISAGGVILMHGHGKNTASGLQKIINTVRAKKLKLQPLK
ncbi:polysaccharide deacetylase family protein [Actinoplanes sp. NPDC048967]|uniref:polysaccharide deacetylase family protein n=1 Tax=Actinoplanes sp. NPDC048967 TaxID=3155269 RepID=UPI0033D3D9AB